jgi:hypothetical protein
MGTCQIIMSRTLISVLIIVSSCLHFQFRFKRAKVEVILNLGCVSVYVVMVIVRDVIWEGRNTSFERLPIYMNLNYK